MKSTGIVRRIDDLGRVVIPKEIRRTLRIKEGDALEIFLDGTEGVFLKKYSQIKVLSDFITGYAECISAETGHIVCISDSDNIIAVSGMNKRELVHKRISHDIETAIDNRSILVRNAKTDEKMIAITDEDENTHGYCSCIIAPIVVSGDPIGAIIILTKDTEVVLGEFEVKFAKATARFVANQMEL